MSPVAADSTRARTVQNPRPRALAGLTWKGIAFLVLICAINSMRRIVQDFEDQPLLDWLRQLIYGTAWGMVIAVPVALCVVVTYNLSPRRPWLRYPLLALVVAVSSLAGVVAYLALEVIVHCGGSVDACFEEPPTAALQRAWVRYGSLCAVFTAVFVYLRTADEDADRALEAERQRALFIQRMEEARLRMLQAQIEPHFLFNTLANVRRLYQTDYSAAESMLENLMRYLAVALPQMRAADSTLDREATLTESYLAIHRIRMGQRLSFEIDIPAPLRDAKLPPMMVLTLAENAIKHGLAPLPQGGSVRVSAAANGNELVVRVADSGRGFTQSSGGGTGLANIRARLAGIYGSAGRLTLALNAPSGVIATIVVPLSVTHSPAPVT